MQLTKKIETVLDIIRVRILRGRVPLAVRWQLTNRCSNQCLYCEIWKYPPQAELSTSQIKRIIDDLVVCGTKTISFSGGEPLLRNDIKDILDYCCAKDIDTSINSNGALVRQKISSIQALGFLKLSLDGPEEIHDRMAHHPGSYRQVLEAIEAAQARGIRTIFTATLTKHNVRHLAVLLAIAKKYNTLVAFQPLKHLSKGACNLDSLLPDGEDYRHAIGELICLKKKGDDSMRNSLSELEYIYHWPRYPRLPCWAGRLFCMIGAGGELYPCDRTNYQTELPNCATLGFKEAFARLPLAITCEGCGFCGTLELNLLLNARLDVLRTIRKITD